MRELMDRVDGIRLVRVDDAVGPELLGQRQALGGNVDGDDARAHRRAEERGAEPDRPLPEDGQRVAARDIEPLERAIGGARAARHGGPLLERQLLGQRHIGPRGHLHVRGMRAVARRAEHRDALATELGPAHAAVLALPAALVVMVHHALTDHTLDLADPRPHRGDDAARLVAGNDRLARTAESECRRLIAGGAVELEVTATHARGLDGQDDLAGPRRGIGKLLDLELALSEKDDTSHGSLLL
jgi:hypothetical protein